ncbi:glycosyltransferase family 39 protein [Paenibacillus rhizovicinus]|uniref:Glycosyltransferase family 39 protein n=1 Tax=Paenibacillus rhizovicinus TaxID=2704463 RepID=A0A6C0P385_9BACL|nr:glycosyltransferase family 39 protein [Paenibacillus rhizovicinus]QHW32958.1 glycosyltransferase family 39 protein [Paenibacillus rhizovicinus]
MKGFKQVKIDLYLLAIAVMSMFLNGYNIWEDKYANTYYTTAVGSMLQSFSNFFYGSLDSAGSVTVDKPPLTFWIQTAFAYVFGLHGWSVILPQALAGVGSVLLIYFILKPTFGVKAARIGSLVLALTPVVPSISRTNNIDSMLVFALLIGTWLLFKGIRNSRTRTVIGAFAMIGVAFNMKMLQAYMVLPAFYLLYILAAKVNWKRKTAVLAGATALMFVISISWAVVVDSIPADKRPYIGSSETNSVMNLAFGYNGVSRLTGDQAPGGGGGGRGGMQDGRGDGGSAAGAGFAAAGAGGAAANGGQDGGGQAAAGSADGSTPGNDGTVPNAGGSAPDSDGTAPNGDGTASGNGAIGGMAAPNGGFGGGFPGQDGGTGRGGFQGGGPGGGGNMFGTGNPGILRLFQSGLSGEASWMIPFVFFACVGLFASFRFKSFKHMHFTQKHREALFWLAWLIPAMMFFSVAGFFHQYYLIMLAAPIAALAGAGWVELWHAYREGKGWTSYLLPISITVTAALQWYVMQNDDDTIGKGWSIGVAAAGVLTTMVLFTLKNGGEFKFKRVIGVVSVFVMLIGPAFWSLTPITYGQSSMTPIVGPEGDSMGFGGGKGGFPAMAEMNGTGGMFPGQDGQQGQDGQNAAGASTDDQNGAAAGGQDNQDQSQQGFPGQDGQSAGGSMPSFGGGGGMPGGMGEGTIDQKTLAYLKAHNTGEEYLFATSTYTSAAPYIIDENEKVVTLGGFSGSDPVYSVEKLQKLVESGKLKYFMISGGGGFGGRGGSSEVTAWIEEHGTVIPTSEWQSSGDSGASEKSMGGMGGRGGGMTLYEVKLQ